MSAWTHFLHNKFWVYFARLIIFFSTQIPYRYLDVVLNLFYEVREKWMSGKALEPLWPLSERTNAPEQENPNLRRSTGWSENIQTQIQCNWSMFIMCTDRQTNLIGIEDSSVIKLLKQKWIWKQWKDTILMSFKRYRTKLKTSVEVELLAQEDHIFKPVAIQDNLCIFQILKNEMYNVMREFLSPKHLGKMNLEHAFLAWPV